MLRFFFWTLLFVNAVFLAFNLGYLGNWSAETHEPARLKLQQKADQLQLLSANAAKVLSEAPLAKANEALACMEIGNFAAADAARFEEQLKALELGERQARSNVTEVATNMVFIPSLGSKEAAEKKAAELRRIGITDFFIVQDQSEMRWGISLGVFKTEDAAKAHLGNLNAKGVRTARIGPRSVSTVKFSFQLRALKVDEKKRLDGIMADFPAQESHTCQSTPNGRN